MHSPVRLALVLVFTLATLFVASVPAHAEDPGFESLFDGKTFAGWGGDFDATWRIEDGDIVAGSPDSAAPQNEFLATARDYGDFELRLEYKLEAKEGIPAAAQRLKIAGSRTVTCCSSTTFSAGRYLTWWCSVGCCVTAMLELARSVRRTGGATTRRRRGPPSPVWSVLLRRRARCLFQTLARRAARARAPAVVVRDAETRLGFRLTPRRRRLT